MKAIVVFVITPRLSVSARAFPACERQVQAQADRLQREQLIRENRDGRTDST
jgi:hypothetical protein